MKIKSSPKVPRLFGSLDRGGLILDFFNIEVIRQSNSTFRRFSIGRQN